MWITEKINNNWKKIIIILFIFFVFISKSYINKIWDKNLKNRQELGFKGIITKKYRQKGGEILLYKDVLSKKIIEISPSDVLQEKSAVGDTLIKLPKGNLCIIKNKKKSIKVECYYLE